VEQGPPDRPEAPAQTERCLGNPVNLAIDSKLRGSDLLRLLLGLSPKFDDATPFAVIPPVLPLL